MIDLTEKLLIKNGIVLTMDENDTVYEDGAVVIEADKITAVGKSRSIEKEYKGDTVIDAR
ncbi:MAG: hypothetical protein QW390_03080 [Candidatus Bathyarchaeia archaeon]